MKYAGDAGAAVRPKLLALSVAACFTLSAPDLPAQTLPTGVTPVAGVTSWNAANGVLTINTIGNSVLRYNSFSIGAGGAVQINQQSAVFASLQRVVGSGGVIPQSVIDGLLQSNGRVFLLNPSGIVIGAGGRIDVAGFVASSLNLSDDDFLKGRMRFGEDPAAQAVKNYGTIQTASGGNVYLIAPQVENHGVIRAPEGQILLAAGKSAELVSDASPYVTVKVVADSEKALNVGQLIADSGKIGIFGALVQNSGVAEANGAVRGPGGEIRFVATKDLTLDAGSRISANGTSGGKVVLQAEGGTNLIGGTVEATGSSGKGGEIQALGVRVGVVGHGIIDASGESGGGTVLVGGDYQGKNSEIQNAQRTFIGADGVIRADAGANGDGGRVIVWADGDTRFYGSISARGGSQSGNGGFVETSGKQSLTALGSVITSAPHGKGGTWLLDPDNIDIVSGTGADDGQIATDGTLAFDDLPGASSVISDLGIQGAMANGSNVVLQAHNDITLQTTVSTTAYGQSLTLQAQHDIALQSYGISTGGDLTLSAGNQISGSGNFLESASGHVTLDGTTNISRSLSITAGNGITTGSINTNVVLTDSTSVELLAYGGSINVNGSITTGLADEGNSTVSLTAQQGSVSVSGPIRTGDSTCCGNADVTLFGRDGISTGSIKTGTSSTNFQGNISLQANNGSVVVGGDLDASGSAGNVNQFYGANGGNITLTAGAGDVNVTGMILAGGGNAYGGVDIFSGGGSGGTVLIRGNVDNMPVPGNVNIGGIDVQGGAAPSASSGFAGQGGSVAVGALGAVSIGSINASGGPGVSNGNDGADAGSINVRGDSSIAINFIAAIGGTGASGTSSGGSGGWGGDVTLTSNGPAVIGAVDVSGGAGGSASSFFAGSGGDAGSVAFGNSSVRVGSATVGVLLARGGAGGDGAEGGSGGFGGFVDIYSSGSITAGIINVSGGNGGSSGGSCCGGGSFGGFGGGITLNSLGSTTVGFLTGRGGAGGAWTSAIGTSGPGGEGGEGAFLDISAQGGLFIGPQPTVAKSQVVIDVSGGAGGAGAPGGGAGGYGGSGGTIFLDAAGMTINGVILGTGAAGGQSDGAAGAGGDGSQVFFSTPNDATIIKFVNGGWNLTAGAGGTDGSINSGIAGVTIPDQLLVAQFIHLGPGDLADIPVANLGIFRFTAISDPLSIPAVLQVVGAPQQQAQQVAEGTVEGNSGDKDDKDKQKTGSLGSCRPS